MIQLSIKEEGLKATQIQWEHVKSQIKRDMEEIKKRDPQAERLGNKLIETIENDLYKTENDSHPNKKGNRN